MVDDQTITTLAGVYNCSRNSEILCHGNGFGLINFVTVLLDPAQAERVCKVDLKSGDGLMTYIAPSGFHEFFSSEDAWHAFYMFSSIR